ncbi:MAG: hypothetical protein Q9160_006966 [Pyrenula sp. 1 TL-2023]
MEPRSPPEYILEVFADPATVKDIVKGVLHLIFFHRYFPSLRPTTQDIPSLDISLPHISDPPELETLIEAKASALAHQLQSMTANGGQRGQLAVRFFEKRRRKSTWFGAGGDEEICWEQWLLEVTIATPRTESERTKVRKAMESSLQKTALKVVTIVNRDKDHIPPITTSEANPFPYQITLDPKQVGWGNRFGPWA